ncbi:ras-related protein rab7-like isoform X2 [Drosophila innubila]|nr:ras-related protein rab7-like isoform X2 [Drosophila innubila]XP_034489054.1 ras-related protein rab7-like isoform X2 [Drosophila innubila]
MSYNYKPFLKVLLLGNPNVGKTALVNRYVNEVFDNNYKVTIGADYFTKDIFLADRIASLQIWDTAGMERFQSLGSAFYRGADCCVLVFDVTNRSSFDSLNSWRDEFFIQTNPPDPQKFPFIVLGNKSDKTDKRQVTMREAQQWCKMRDITYYETSAKDDSCVDVAFETITALVLDSKPEHEYIADFSDSFIVVDGPSRWLPRCWC